MVSQNWDLCMRKGQGQKQTNLKFSITTTKIDTFWFLFSQKFKSLLSLPEEDEEWEEDDADEECPLGTPFG